MKIYKSGPSHCVGGNLGDKVKSNLFAFFRALTSNFENFARNIIYHHFHSNNSFIAFHLDLHLYYMYNSQVVDVKDFLHNYNFLRSGKNTIYLQFLIYAYFAFQTCKYCSFIWKNIDKRLPICATMWLELGSVSVARFISLSPDDKWFLK